MNAGIARIAVASASVLTVLLGLILYQLMEIPFGALFDWTLLLFGFAMASALGLAGLLAWRSRTRWVKWLALVCWMLAPMAFLLAIVILLDVRILYFQSLPPRASKAEWTEDLKFLAKQMSEKHRDLFALVSQEQWSATVGEIERRIPSLQEREIPMELFRLSALPNDNHLFPFVMAPCFNLHSFPFIVFGFPEGWHIVNAGRGYRDLIGGRILRIGGQSVEEIYRRYPLLLAAENEWSRRERFTYMVVMAEWLAYNKIIGDTGEAEFTLRLVDGTERVLMVPSVQFNLAFRWSGLTAIANDEPPVFINPRSDAYAYRMLANGRVLYIQLNQCIDQPGRETAAQFAQSLWESLADREIDRCIIDLRNNDGGNDVFGELLSLLRDDRRMNRRGRLFALIGRRTQSAAVRFATQLQMQTNILFVGEPTGQGPVFYGGPTLVELPHSGLLFGVSTHLAVAGFPFDARSALEPDIPVAYGIEDFRSGHDPVLEAALGYEEPQEERRPQSLKAVGSYTGRYLANETLVMDVTQAEGRMTVRVTDFLPRTRQHFISDLRWEDAARFETKVRGVKIEFLRATGSHPPQAVLGWMDTRLVFGRAEEGFISAFELFSRGDVAEGCERIRAEHDRYRTVNPDLEQTLNRLGYQYLRGGATQAALQTFSLNVELYPQSYNVYDSYGEALMVDGKIDSAIANYRRSLELNPENRNAARVIERLSDLR